MMLSACTLSFAAGMGPTKPRAAGQTLLVEQDWLKSAAGLDRTTAGHAFVPL